MRKGNVRGWDLSKKSKLDEQIEQWAKEVEEGGNPPPKDLVGALKRLQLERTRYPWHTHVKMILGFGLLLGHLYFLYVSFETPYKWLVGAYVFPMAALLFDYVRLLTKKEVRV